MTIKKKQTRKMSRILCILVAEITSNGTRLFRIAQSRVASENNAALKSKIITIIRV